MKGSDEEVPLLEIANIPVTANETKPRRRR
jgi:hypothetical protein